ncbi:hypothetical protein BD779DRAFT_1457330 [Infundibulicybe gibba]|nr:hypothetical protein BD779DRAFT_1457330 [Infundibulicybe gibba]
MSPTMLQGASKATGGVLRGQALGNTPNMADLSGVESAPQGKVFVYVSEVNPAVVDPNFVDISMSVQHQVTNHIAPVL